MAQALIFVLVILVVGIHDAEAQRFRGGMRGGSRSGAGAQVFIRSPHGFSQAGGFIVQRTPGTFVRIGPVPHQLLSVASIPVFVTPVFATPWRRFSLVFGRPSVLLSFRDAAEFC
jgi:hypothetical protein